MCVCTIIWEEFLTKAEQGPIQSLHPSGGRKLDMFERCYKWSGYDLMQESHRIYLCLAPTFLCLLTLHYGFIVTNPVRCLSGRGASWGQLFPLQRLGQCHLLSVPWQQVLDAGQQIQGVLPGLAVSSLQRKWSSALPDLQSITIWFQISASLLCSLKVISDKLFPSPTPIPIFYLLLARKPSSCDHFNPWKNLITWWHFVKLQTSSLGV